MEALAQIVGLIGPTRLSFNWVTGPNERVKLTRLMTLLEQISLMKPSRPNCANEPGRTSWPAMKLRANISSKVTLIGLTKLIYRMKLIGLIELISPFGHATT